MGNQIVVGNRWPAVQPWRNPVPPPPAIIFTISLLCLYRDNVSASEPFPRGPITRETIAARFLRELELRRPLRRAGKGKETKTVPRLEIRRPCVPLDALLRRGDGNSCRRALPARDFTRFPRSARKWPISSRPVYKVRRKIHCSCPRQFTYGHGLTNSDLNDPPHSRESTTCIYDRGFIE